MSLDAQQLLEELNRLRALGCACGDVYLGPCAPVTRDARLDAAAQRHAENMALRDVLDHVGAHCSSPFDRMRAAGYAFRAAAENIACGNAAALATLQQWVHSPGHCQAMMSALYTQVGIGHARSQDGQSYWTLDLAAP